MPGLIDILNYPNQKGCFLAQPEESVTNKGRKGLVPRCPSGQESEVMELSSHFLGCSQGYPLGRGKGKGTDTY